MKRAHWEDGRALVNGWRLRVMLGPIPGCWVWRARGWSCAVEVRVSPVNVLDSVFLARRAAVAWARKQAFGGEGER